ncbi:MAG: glycerol-3-phosphate acyltransferase [Actinobacteria bacterium]|nr:glycerol-3-phosphate acyltransferase [Actinomycetota bacterium]
MSDISTPILYWPLLLLGAYLLGSVPFAQVLARIKGVDLREVGTGNVGAGNLTHEFGKGWGTLAAVLDGLKGFFPVWIARKAGLGLGAAGLAGVAAVIGHNWSIWLRGRSGRGMATSAGVLLGLDPALLVWTTGWSIAGWKVGSGLGGFLGWGLLPIVAVALGRPPTESLLLLLLTVVLMARRAQGNPDSSLGRGPALWRVIHDNDQVDEEFPDTVEEPLTP